MSLALALSQVPRYGFYGLHGFLGVILGLTICLILIWGIWSVFNILAAKFGGGELAWIVQILRVILIVAVAVWFINAVFQIF